MARALVPLKDLVQAKSRLAGVLRPSERRALAQAMAEDVLTVLSRHRDITQVTVVSDDPGAGLLAARYATDCWSEAALGCRGLNAVVQRASARLLAAAAEPLIVLHADLPLLSAADISAVLQCRQQLGGLVIASDVCGAGTNLLAFDRASEPQFCFGADSCASHLAWARAAGVPAQVLQRPGIGLDVDEARDLALLTARLDNRGGTQTAALLCDSELGARITLALATLDDGDEQSEKGRAS